MWVLIWDYCQQDPVKFPNFHFIYSLFRENTETKFAGEKKTFVPYFISFSVIYSFYGFFESRARRTIFQNVSLFPYISMFTVHFVAYLSSSLELSRRCRTVHDHQGRQSASSSFSSFLFLTEEGGRKPNPRSKLSTFFSNSDIYHLYLKLLCEYWENCEFEMFSNCAGKY